MLVNTVRDILTFGIMNSRTLLAIFLFAVVYLVRCIKGYELDIPGQGNIQTDLIPEATNHHHGHGRVQIKVYRGPSEGHEHFAPHGYWVKQPADDHHG